MPHIFTEGALEYGIISTSVNALKPYLKPFHTGAIVDFVGDGGSGLNSGPHSGSRPRTQGLYMLSSILTDKKDSGQSTTTTIQSKNGNNGPQPQPKFYIGNSEVKAAILSRGDAQQDDTESVGSNSSKQMIIRTTKEWRVETS